MTALRAYKFLVAPVLQQVDEDGVVVDEIQPQQPDAVFGVDGLLRYAEGFEDALARHAQAIENGGANGGNVVRPMPESRKA